MFLTVGILVSDKDLDNLENLISQIREKVQIKNEIIICNNASKVIAIKDAIVLNNGNGNIYQLRGRKQIIEQAKGDYIWFIDADDAIGSVQDEELHGDIVEFSYSSLLDDNLSYVDIGDFQTDVKYSDFISLIDNGVQPLLNGLWNKFIKTSFLKELIKKIPNENVSALEDYIYLYGVMTLATHYQYSGQRIYVYNRNESSCGCEDYSNCFNKFERSIFGITEGMRILREITDSKIDNYFGNLEVHNAKFYLNKILTTENDDVCHKMMNSISEHFEWKDINEATWQILDGLCTEKTFTRFANIVESKIELKREVEKYGTKIITSPKWEDYTQQCENLYGDKDIEGNPFTLNCNTAEIEISKELEDSHIWIENSKRWKYHDNSIKEDTYIIHFSFGNACNLHCSYCFADKENAHEICLAEQQSVIDKVFELYEGKINHVVLNNNGEPFFNGEAFWEVYDYLKMKGLQDYQIQINTNGVDYSETDVKRLVERGGINISIDGMKEIQDAHRGEGTYDSIIEDITPMIDAGCDMCATCVIMDDDVPIFGILEHLYKIGFKSHIFFSPVRVTDYWTDERKEKLYARYEEFYKELEKRVCVNHEFYWISVFVLDLNRIRFGTFWKNCPRYSPNFLDFDGQGNVFACYEEVGCSDKIIGNIFTSNMDELFEKRKETLKERNFISESCIEENCPFINFCGGKNNFCEHSDKKMLCSLEKLKWKYLLRIYAYVEKSYIPEEREFLFADSTSRVPLFKANPQLLALDKEFAKYWYNSRNAQNAFKSGELNKDDFKIYVE